MGPHHLIIREGLLVEVALKLRCGWVDKKEPVRQISGGQSIPGRIYPVQ